MQTSRDHTSQDYGEKFPRMSCYQASFNYCVISTAINSFSCCLEKYCKKCKSLGVKGHDAMTPTMETPGKSCEVNVHYVCFASPFLHNNYFSENLKITSSKQINICLIEDVSQMFSFPSTFLNAIFQNAHIKHFGNTANTLQRLYRSSSNSENFVYCRWDTDYSQGPCRIAVFKEGISPVWVIVKCQMLVYYMLVLYYSSRFGSALKTSSWIINELKRGFTTAALVAE